MTDEKLDLLLRQALNLEIADHDIQIDAAKIKSDRNTTSWKYWKHFPAAAASVAVLTLSSMMVCAAWHYLSAKDVAGKAADPHLINVIFVDCIMVVIIKSTIQQCKQH